MSADAAAALGPAPSMASNAPKARHRYRPEVDGLRAIAVLPVIFFHAGFDAFSGGYVGVDVFFAISGYLITTIILTERLSDRFSVASFYERRARRILPALFTVLLFCVPFAWWWMLPGELASFGDSLWAVSVFGSNFEFWRTSGYFGGAAELKPLLHTWSLGIEEQYYVFFPAVVIVMLRWGIKGLVAGLLAIALCSLGLSVFLTAREPMMNFFLLPSRAWELLAGSLLAAVVVAGRLPVVRRSVRETAGGIGLALIVIPMLLYGEDTPFPGLAAIPPVLGTVLLLAFTDGKSAIGRVLASRPLLTVGLISYSAYLWHQPLFAFARMMSPNAVPAGAYVGLSALALLLAWFSWRYIEAPFRDRRNFTRRGIFTMAALGSLLFVATGAFLSMSHGAPWRVDSQYRHLVAPANNLIEGCPADGPRLFTCVIGVSGKAPTVAMVGDSHSYALARTLDAELKARGRAGIIVHTACHPIPAVFDSREPLDPSYRAECRAANDALIARVSQPSIQTVIVAIRWTLRLVPMDGEESAYFDNYEGGVEGDAPFRRNLTFQSDGSVTASGAGKEAALARYVERLGDGRRVVLIYPVPEAGWTPARLNMIALARGQEPPKLITTSQARYRERNAGAIEALDAIDSSDVVRVRPEQILCGRPFAGRCIIQRGRTSFYFDDDHLSAEGARLVVRDALSRL